ncbi:hypothetical protein OH77DRAFT_1424630 [Trametes cingulata]|nr:hypothetical protein OH77DRAFT_1424630 [Trametes cingulata]
MLGTWNGSLQGAPKAVQTLTLVSGGCHRAFNPQLHALDNVRDFVLKALSRGAPTTEQTDGKIHLKRRVFDRVRPGDDTGTNIRVPVAEDPLARARKVEGLWAIRHHIEAGVQQTDGRVTRENPRSIRPGDFVDVAITLQAISIRVSRGRRCVEVMFVPQTILRLIPSEQSVALLREIELEDSAQQPVTEVIVGKRDVGFSFDGDAEKMTE